MNEYSQMVKDLAKPGKDIIAALTPMGAHMLHMVGGLVTEVIELKEHELLTAEELKLTNSTIIEELGDIEFYFEGLCQSMRMDVPLSGATYPFALSLDLLVVEAGNVVDLVLKKMIVYNKDVDLMTFVNQITNFRIALDKVYSYYNLTQAEALEHNLNKLLKAKNARYKEGTYSDKAAQERLDKAEEEIKQDTNPIPIESK